MFRAALFAPALLLPFLIGQAAPGPALRRSTPNASDLGMVVRQAGAAAVTAADGGPVAVSLPFQQTAAFGAVLAVGETIPIALSFPYNNINPELVRWELDGGTSSISADGGHAIITTSTDGGYALFSSRESARYVPGQGLSTRFTFVSSGCKPGQWQTVGAGDEMDGFFFGCCDTCSADGGSSFAVLRRSSGTFNWTPAAQWNGPWGTTPPDITRGRPYQIQWQWLGYGQITYSIEDETVGGFVVAHSIKYAGTATTTSIANPSLPLHAHVQNPASTAENTLQVPSMSLVRQGPEPMTGLRRTAGNTLTLSTVERGIISLRNNSTFNAKTNRTQILVDHISWAINGSAAQDVEITLRLNGTLISPSWTPTNVTQSISSTNIDGGIFFTGIDAGTVWLLLQGASNSSETHDLTTDNIHLTPGDVLTVSGRAYAGGPDLRVSISWIEEF